MDLRKNKIEVIKEIMAGKFSPLDLQDIELVGWDKRPDGYHSIGGPVRILNKEQFKIWKSKTKKEKYFVLVPAGENEDE